VAATAAAVAVAASAVAETLLLSSQAFLLLLARSFLLWLAGRLAPCFLEVAALILINDHLIQDVSSLLLYVQQNLNDL
jgi:hypothetical protein